MTMMIVALITVGSEPASSREGQETFTELLEDLYSHTAGRLLRKLRNEAELGPEFEALLKSAIDLRNGLAHRWFREQSAGFGSANGMQRMVDDLDLARKTFERASAQVYAHAAMILSSLAGVQTQQEVEMLRDRYLRDFEAGRSGG